MKRTVTGATLVAALLLTGCGSEPDVTAGDPVDEAAAPAADFATLDVDGDSYLDLDEIPEGADRSVFERWDADADSEVDRDEITGNAFQLWDSDSNGAISATEWQQGAELWYPRTVRVAPLQDADGDGDSALDADEFAEQFDYTALGETWRDDRLDQEAFRNAYFELYDSDGDGKVSEVEFRTGLPLLGGFTES